MNSDRVRTRRSSFPFRKKSDATSKIPSLKPGAKKPVSKSPSLPKRQLSPDPGLSKPRTGSTGHLAQAEETQPPISRSIEDIEKDEDSGARENGSGSSDILDDVDSTGSDAARTKAAIEHLQEKISKIMEQIKDEQVTKEGNVNEYLQLASEADKVQLQRIKQVFEKKNAKSTANLSQLQKKLENYNKKLKDVETYGAHKQAKEVLKDVGQGLKDVGANIRDGISGFSGGVVDNIKGAKETIVSKPREFAHLIKNKFGSADNINTFKGSEDGHIDDLDKPQGGGTLPARELGGVCGQSDEAKAQSFKYTASEEDASSITSGSGLGAQTSPQNSQNTSQQVLIPQEIFDHLLKEIKEAKENSDKMQESLQRVTDDFENYKLTSQQETCHLRASIDEDIKFRMERIEEQMNDITELNQHEVTNLKQAISSMEEKTDYRLEELMADLHDQLENCQTRVTKMELQQQQQQIISMEMVENVTFRTILTKLINVVLALLAVILVFVSTTANLVAPFLTSRARILSTAILIVCIVLSWNNRAVICDFFVDIWNNIRYLLPKR